LKKNLISKMLSSAPGARKTMMGCAKDLEREIMVGVSKTAVEVLGARLPGGRRTMMAGFPPREERVKALTTT
jgi:hypothetical protein